MTNGQIAYEAYRNHTGGKSLISGLQIPEWGQLNGEIQAAWEAAACQVASALAYLVAQMRHAQADYFRLRSTSVLQQAKQLERQVDKACREVLDGERQKRQKRQKDTELRATFFSPGRLERVGHVDDGRKRKPVMDD